MEKIVLVLRKKANTCISTEYLQKQRLKNTQKTTELFKNANSDCDAT